MQDLARSSHTHTVVTPDRELSEVAVPLQKPGRFPRLRLPKLRIPGRKKRQGQPEGSRSSKKRGLPKAAKIALIITLVLVIVLGAVGGVAAMVGLKTYRVAMNIKSQADETKVVAQSVVDQLKTQNLPGAEASLVDVQDRVRRMKEEYEKLAFYQRLPIAKTYYQDGLHGFAAADAGINAGLKTVDAIVPYADVLGFAGEGTFTGGKAEDRIRLMLETLGKISPVLDGITTDLQAAQTELDQIDASRYPEQFQGVALRSQLENAQTTLDGAVGAITELRPAIEVLPQIAGSETRKKYLVIFQNDNELRPTGGFMTAYAVLFIEDGKVTPEKSDDIYELDKKFRTNLPIPDPLGKYLTTEKRFNLRDMNVDPDFRTSMDTFYEHFQELPGEPGDIDGIISVDTNLLTELVRVLGPVDVPGYGTFSAQNDPRCDCPQIIYILSEIVDRPTPYIRENRKGIIAPMMQAILQKAYSAPKELWPQLVELGWKKIEARHVQFYFFDESHQAAAEAVNGAGGMQVPTDGSDYIAIVDANLGGAKSNLFVETEGEFAVGTPEGGELAHTLTLKYKNTRKGDNCNLEAGQLCLNGTLRDWVRIYLPKGAKLTQGAGFDDGTLKQREEGEFTIIEGVFRLAPLAQATFKVEYTTPYEESDTYKLYMRKQAGTDPWKYLIDVNGHEEEIILDKDKKVEIDF